MATFSTQDARGAAVNGAVLGPPIEVPGVSAIHQRGGINVWSIDLDRRAADLETLRSVLSGEERCRMEAFRFQLLRDRFAVCRATLRLLLAQYLGQPASHVRLSSNAFGKPHIGNGTSLIRFNVSHSESCALIAFTFDGREVGIDVERVAPLDDLASLAATVFSRAELAEFHAVPASQRMQAFFNGWTRKEAYVKAIGAGLQRPLQSFDVTLSPDAHARLVCVDGSAADAARWTIEALTVRSGFAAAICYERSRRESARTDPGRGQ